MLDVRDTSLFARRKRIGDAPRVGWKKKKKIKKHFSFVNFLFRIYIILSGSSLIDFDRGAFWKEKGVIRKIKIKRIK